MNVSFPYSAKAQPHFTVSVPGIIGPLLKMTLVPDVELRKSALPVFFDLLEFEHRNRGHFKQVGSLQEQYFLTADPNTVLLGCIVNGYCNIKSIVIILAQHFCYTLFRFHL